MTWVNYYIWKKEGWIVYYLIQAFNQPWWNTCQNIGTFKYHLELPSPRKKTHGDSQKGLKVVAAAIFQDFHNIYNCPCGYINKPLKAYLKCTCEAWIAVILCYNLNLLYLSLDFPESNQVLYLISRTETLHIINYRRGAKKFSHSTSCYRPVLEELRTIKSRC